MAATDREATQRPTVKRKASSNRRTATKRELIDTGTEKRYVRRDATGRFKESDDVARSMSQSIRGSTVVSKSSRVIIERTARTYRQALKRLADK